MLYCSLLITFLLKRHYVVLEENFFDIYNINKVIIQTQKYLFFPEVNKQADLRGK